MIPLLAALRYNQGMTNPGDDMDDINSREDLVEFIYGLLNELEQHPGAWANNDLSSFLHGLAGFLRDAGGYYRNFKRNVDANVPSWRLMADSLQAASVYE